MRANGERWNRFLVSPDGKRLLVAQPQGEPLSLGAWRKRSGRK